MEQLPPIPTPPAQRWREFRIQILPIVFFLTVAVTISVLWRSYITPAGIVGEVEAIRASVTVVEPGTVAELSVELFQTVTNGQRLGLVRMFDPENTSVQIEAMRAEMKVLEQRMAADRQRNRQDHLQLRVNLLDQKVQLEQAKAELDGAIKEQERQENLYALKDPLVSQSELDLARTQRRSLQAQVDERVKLVVEAEQTLKELNANEDPLGGSNNPVSASIAAQEKQLETAERPHVLKAPIDGIVSAILLRPGEKVLAGQAIITITSPQAERIMGYVRPPIEKAPEVGMEVEVRPRAFKRRVGVGQVLGVGVQLESISTARFQTGMSSNVFEQALPVVISLPASLNLLPGEVVDLTLKAGRR
jgi:multidrug resistance efflux pump